ncbi:hypothetical protein FMEAI12_3860002 [Parafrankia sp. Ea1.12]|nr:hypothetical protein FMEAI12_3860002 [Parafrankia sp. Ea1.12]
MWNAYAIFGFTKFQSRKLLDKLFHGKTI